MLVIFSSQLSRPPSTAQTIGIHTLRRKLGIIPQDSFMFSGTLRENLDPFAQYGDDRLWQALADTNLKAFVESSLDKQLDAEVRCD